MTYVRLNVYDPSATATVQWYGKAVQQLGEVAIAQPQSWAFFGAMHGFEQETWDYFGYDTTNLPSPQQMQIFWAQCQHQSWYFLPWHRGYILAFEAMIRATVAKLGGPNDWALPYWDYGNAQQENLPPAFADPNGPLFIKPRYGPNGDGDVTVPADQIDFKALGNPSFVGKSRANAGFGGVPTGFSHSNNINGGLENQPHNAVHGLVGGVAENTDPNDWHNYGIMAMPDTAALDPIFWLHHCNIDRLWESWNRAGNADPVSNAKWMGGPAATGGRPFVMPMPNGQSWTYTPADVMSIATLGYSYQALASVPKRKTKKVAADMGGIADLTGGQAAMAEGQQPAALVGASEARISLAAPQTDVAVRLDQQAAGGMRDGFAAAFDADSPPPRVFLNLENVRGAADAMTYKVYVNVPDGQDPADHPDLLAGSIGLFGVAKASRSEGPHGGNGLSFSLDVTDVLGKLHVADNLDPAALNVKIVPRTPQSVPDVTVDRISLYREPA